MVIKPKNKQKYFQIIDTILVSVNERFVANKDLLSDLAWLGPEKYDDIKNLVLEEFPPETFVAISKLANVDRVTIISELKQFAEMYYALESEASSVGEEENVNAQAFELDSNNSDSEEESDEECEHAFTKVYSKTCKNCLHCAFKVLFQLSSQTGLFNDLFLVFKYALLLPCTQVTCERVFSKLKVLKNRLRSEMGQDLLVPLMMLYVERDICNTIDHDVIIDIIASSSKELQTLLTL